MTDFVLIKFLYPDGNPKERLQEVKAHFETTGFASRVEARDEIPSGSRLVLSAGNGGIHVKLEAFKTREDQLAAPDVPVIQLYVDNVTLTAGDPETNVTDLISFVKGIYEATDPRPAYVYGLDPYDVEAVGEFHDHPVSAASLEDNRIQFTSWLMLFPPEMVETYSREMLYDAPVWHAEDFNDGAVLLVAASDPTQVNDVSVATEELREYFGFSPRE